MTNDPVLQLAPTPLDPLPVNVTLDMKETVTSAKISMNAKEELIIVIARQRVQTPLAPLTVHVTWDLKEVELYAMISMNAKGKLITAIRTTGSAPTHTEVLSVLVRILDLKAMESSVKTSTNASVTHTIVIAPTPSVLTR